MAQLQRHAAILLVLLAVVAPSAAQETYERLPSIELPAELDRVLREYEVAWEEGESEALAALFTTDGFVPSGPGWIRGRGPIAAHYDETGGDLRLRAHAYGVADSVGYIVGAYGYGEGATETDRGKFLLALRQSADGKWLIAADLDNSNRTDP